MTAVRFGASRRLNVPILGIVGKISGEEHQVGTLWERVDHFHRALECLGAKLDPAVR